MVIVELHKLPAARSIEFLLWVVENKIGNWEKMCAVIADNPSWHLSEEFNLECSDEEATWILMRWA